MSSQKEEHEGKSEEESSSGFGWLAIGVATGVGGVIGAAAAALTFLSIGSGSTEGPQCNVSDANTNAGANGENNETFRNRPLTCEPCGVCLDDIALVVTLTCDHRFHANCVEKWIKDNGTCPICRMKIRPDQMKYSV